MKKFILLTIGILLTSIGLHANTTTYNNINKPFVFVESGIEFAIFKDGQFDFNVIQPNVGVHINTRNINFSFNTGYDYDAYVQYDDYGAVVQIENTPVFYDYYGRVNRIGNIRLHYNHLGLAYRIGNLNIFYNNYGTYNHCSGYVNAYNINYGYRPHHRYYRIPPANHCIVYNNPYRQTYTVNRCNYVTYRNNYYTGYYNRPYKFRNYNRPGTHVSINHHYNSNRTRYTNRSSRNNATYYNNKVRNTRPYTSPRRTTTNTRTYTPRANSTNRSYASNSTRTQNNTLLI
ncbi:hypothetical protein [Aquimarina agarilytica]|uniref:hypothetical protein n=1 Tax=Aquimarina agarilytica TaxID=1087449 RepID=UPI0002899ACF|nr:hypothetical protein [Aquimarina agarilytica]